MIVAWCSFGKHYGVVDIETSTKIQQTICHECSREQVRPFETTGWVTCAVCGEQITEGWEEGRIGEQEAIHYCYEHSEEEKTSC